MKRALMVLALLSVSAYGAESPDPDVLAVREAAWRAWFGGDEAALRSILPTEFLSIGAGSAGIADLEKTIAESRTFKASGGRLVALTFPETQAQRFGDTVVLYGSYEATFARGSEEKQMKGWLTEVFVKRDGRWVHPGWHLDLR